MRRLNKLVKVMQLVGVMLGFNFTWALTSRRHSFTTVAYKTKCNKWKTYWLTVIMHKTIGVETLSLLMQSFWLVISHFPAIFPSEGNLWAGLPLNVRLKSILEVQLSEQIRAQKCSGIWWLSLIHFEDKKGTVRKIFNFSMLGLKGKGKWL